MRVYFDASVLIAALLSPSGGSALLLKYLKSKRLIGITSQTALEEIFDKTEKLKRSQDEVEQFIADSSLLVRESISIEEINPYQNAVHREDAHLIAGAFLTKSTHLVTLDKKHLLREEVQKKFSSLRIVSPKDLLEKIIK